MAHEQYVGAVSEQYRSWNVILIFPMILLKFSNFLLFLYKKLEKEIVCIYIEGMIYFVKQQPFAI